MHLLPLLLDGPYGGEEKVPKKLKWCKSGKFHP